MQKKQKVKDNPLAPLAVRPTHLYVLLVVFFAGCFLFGLWTHMDEWGFRAALHGLLWIPICFASGPIPIAPVAKPMRC